MPELLGGVLKGHGAFEQAVLGADAGPANGMVERDNDRGGTLIGRARGRRAYG